MDNGESPGIQEPSSASTCSQSTARGRAGMETNGGTRSTVWGLRTMDPENNLMVFERGSLASTNTGAPNVMCRLIHAIWCGENLILFPLHTFNSTVKKWPEVLQANRSGVPSKLLFSSLIHEICGIDFLILS